MRNSTRKKLKRLRNILPVIFIYTVIAIFPSALLAYFANLLNHPVIMVYAMALCGCFLFICVREIVLNQYIDFTQDDSLKKRAQ